MNQTSAPLAAEISEIDTFGIETIASQTVAVPAIKAAPIRMEARLHQYVPIANHEGQIITDLFIVEITDFYFDSAVLMKNISTFYLKTPTDCSFSRQ